MEGSNLSPFMPLISSLLHLRTLGESSDERMLE